MLKKLSTHHNYYKLKWQCLTDDSMWVVFCQFILMNGKVCVAFFTITVLANVT